jgi:hypothetical protein
MGSKAPSGKQMMSHFSCRIAELEMRAMMALLK